MSIFLPYQPEAGRNWKYWTKDNFSFNLPDDDLKDLKEDSCGNFVSADRGIVLVPKEVVCLRDKAAEWETDIPLYVLEIAGVLGIAGKLTLSADMFAEGLGVPISYGQLQSLDTAIQGAAIALSEKLLDSVITIDRGKQGEASTVLVFTKDLEHDAFLSKLQSARELFYQKALELFVLGVDLPAPETCDPRAAVIIRRGKGLNVVVCRELSEAVLYMRKTYLSLKQRCQIAGVEFSGRFADDGMSFSAIDENNSAYEVEVSATVDSTVEDEF